MQGEEKGQGLVFSARLTYVVVAQISHLKAFSQYASNFSGATMSAEVRRTSIRRRPGLDLSLVAGRWWKEMGPELVIGGSIVDGPGCINEVDDGRVKNRNSEFEEGVHWSDACWISMISLFAGIWCYRSRYLIRSKRRPKRVSSIHWILVLVCIGPPNCRSRP